MEGKAGAGTRRRKKILKTFDLNWYVLNYMDMEEKGKATRRK